MIGQTSVHWGRKEFGNIGNYYVTEVFFREIHRVFPKADIYTTIQLSEEFCENENVNCVDLDIYYGWTNNDLDITLKEFSIASIYNKTNVLISTTPFIIEVLKSDIIIDHSGDMWGKNADLVGNNRFVIGLLKDRVVQLLRKEIVLLGCSPGPFNMGLMPLIKEVINGFHFITTRDGLSIELLRESGIKTDNIQEFACPSYLFKGFKRCDIIELLKNTPLNHKEKPVVGFSISGWNMSCAPFSKWPRNESEYNLFIELIDFITDELGLIVCLISHSNGFNREPEFKLIHGRDFLILKQLYENIQRHRYNEKLFLFEGVYSPKETKAIIGQFDMMISGRLHGAVAAFSQNIPTVIIDYGHEPKAHKLRGYAKQLNMEKCVVNPNDIENMKYTVKNVWENRKDIKEYLNNSIPLIKEKATKGFDILTTLCH
ncbi:MAG: polysaccharide pyruvyl transferase family protein [Candidatus Lokiarchaeota archaeon]|nr:polysaccharide pyruvyl transferase family protein [Candidatus Lokiarchaeota archaeon]